MNSYEFEVWYRYGEFEKDFENVTVIAETLEKAKEEVMKIRRWIFKVIQL